MTRSGRSAARVGILTRYPHPGAVKTRLVPVLGEAGAAETHRVLAAHCVRRARPLQATGEARIDVWYEGGSRRNMRRWLGPGLTLHAQRPGDLGSRLRDAFETAFAEGAERVAVIGSDCPELDATHLREAFARVDECDVVLGPAQDGGYYLVATRGAVRRRALDALFGAALPWGTDAVLERTLSRLREAKLSYCMLATLHDIDRPEDLPVFAQVLAEQDRVKREARVSVIIPTLDEEDTVRRAIESATMGGAFEVTVADGGSADGTREIAEALGASVVECASVGRAAQMNEGASAATGDVLLFLHADTVLPPHFAEHVREALLVPHAVAGAFDFGLEGAFGWRESLAERVGRLRSRLTNVPYGDQALFVGAETFSALGGFPDVPVMEDWEFVRRLKRLGSVVHAPAVARTSPRSFREHGLVRSTTVNIAVVAGYRLRVDPVRLARWRRGIARSMSARAR